MRLLVSTLMLAVVVQISSVSPAAAGDARKPEKAVRSDSRILCFIAIPWPLHKRCSCIDSDGDGVCDDSDRCPGTPRGIAVDNHGCPVKVSKIETIFLDTGVFSTSNIMFEFEKADLKPESHKILDEIGGILVKWPEIRIEIAGHTDSKGTEEFNQKLSEARARSVLDYLTARFKKIRPSNYVVKGYGESRPVASNDTEKGRARNRRVEFKILNKEKLKREIKHEKYKEK